MSNPLDRFLGDPAKAFIKRQKRSLDAINALEKGLEKLSDEKLKAKTTELKKRLAEKLKDRNSDPLALLDIHDKAREKKEINAVLEAFLPEAFAVVREAAKRAVGQRHFDVQLGTDGLE